ncbi:hypothetical protein [Rubritalea tangerina]
MRPIMTGSASAAGVRIMTERRSARSAFGHCIIWRERSSLTDFGSWVI